MLVIVNNHKLQPLKQQSVTTNLLYSLCWWRWLSSSPTTVCFVLWHFQVFMRISCLTHKPVHGTVTFYHLDSFRTSFPSLAPSFCWIWWSFGSLSPPSLRVIKMSFPREPLGFITLLWALISLLSSLTESQTANALRAKKRLPVQQFMLNTLTHTHSHTL